MSVHTDWPSYLVSRLTDVCRRQGEMTGAVLPLYKLSLASETRHTKHVNFQSSLLVIFLIELTTLIVVRDFSCSTYFSVSVLLNFTLKMRSVIYSFVKQSHYMVKYICSGKRKVSQMYYWYSCLSVALARHQEEEFSVLARSLYAVLVTLSTYHVRNCKICLISYAGFEHHDRPTSLTAW